MSKREKWLAKVAAECPECEILSSDAERLIYAHGCYPLEYKWILQGAYKYLPDAILRPNTVEEIQAILRLANEDKIPMIPFGGGSGIVGGTIPEEQEVMIDTKQLTEFSINPINMTARGGAGLTGAEFENLLNEAGFTCGQYPQSFQSAVMGGMVATRAIGTFSTKYGKMDDMVTGLEVVLPTGELLKTHGAPKRSTGPELMELFLGSEGCYGVVTAVEMKIYPVAEVRFFESYTFEKTEAGLEAIRNILHAGFNPAVVRLYDEVEAASKIEKYGYEEGYAFLILGYEGNAELVELEKKVASRMCLAQGAIPKGTYAGNDWFHTRFSTKHMLDYDARRGGTADAIEVAAPWDSIADVWREMRKALAPITTEVHCHFSHVYHNGASVYVIFHANTDGDDFEGEKRYRECLETAIKTSIANGGNVSHHHGTGKAKAEFLPLEHGQAGVYVMKAIKAALDPNRILNRGVMGL